MIETGLAFDPLVEIHELLSISLTTVVWQIHTRRRQGPENNTPGDFEQELNSIIIGDADYENNF